MRVLSAAILAGCEEESTGSPPVNTCEPSAWLSAVPIGEDGPAGGVVAPVDGDPLGTVLLVRFGPFKEDRRIDSIRIMGARSCEVPPSLSVGAWPSAGALPSGDPHQNMAECEVAAVMGASEIELDPVEIPAGSFAWVARDLDGSCNALGPEIEGVESLLWRPDGSGWVAVDGQALISPVTCD